MENETLKYKCKILNLINARRIVSDRRYFGKYIKENSNPFGVQNLFSLEK